MTPNDAVMDALRDVIDPELGIDVVRLGMIREVSIESDGHVIVHMTLTTATCPFWDLFVEQVRIAVEGIAGVSSVELVYRGEPEWNVDLLERETRRKLEIRGFLPTEANGS